MPGESKGLFPEIDPARVGNGRRRRRLFLPKFLSAAGNDARLASPERDRAHAIIIKWADLESKGKLARRKETALEGEFIGEVFGEALGYTFFSQDRSSWQLEPRFAIPGGQEADAAIGFFSQQDRNPRVVIELEGPRVDVDRFRSQGRTPVQQCWDYLAALPQCPWGIVCNILSFRLYHRDRTPYAYELFTLQDLRNATTFREFYAIFSVGGLLPSILEQKPRADLLLDLSEKRQLTVGQELYAKYRDQRVGLIDLIRQPPHGRPLDDAIRIVQKLLDRIIFIAFCEDRDLLPTDAIDRAWREIGAWTHAVNPRWDNFKNLFKSIDQGNPRSGITAYNGGLFAHDSDVDDLDLSDSHTDFFREIGTYDFKYEVNVDVLGHLFEQSVTDLEALRTDPDTAFAQPAQPAGRRKREGIYYTPRAITEYLVDQTVGALVRERFSALAAAHQIDPLAEPSKQQVAARIAFDRARLDVLLRLRVCDPACGSGAFLIEAHDQLEELYDEVITSLCMFAGREHEPLFDQISGNILGENLHGVDLSAEAVEITQLALWLRTAKRGRTLADLSGQIKAGNSLVDDHSVDPQALDWQEAFPSIMAEGGFDCIIGNPPYVKLQNFRARSPRVAAHLVERYRAARTGNFDMYLPFIERGLELLRDGGRLGFIAPNVWLFNEYGRGLRELVAERKTLRQFVDFKSHQVFKDATTYTALQIFGKDSVKTIQAADASHGELNDIKFFPVSYTGLSAEPWALVGDWQQSILDRMREGSITLAEASAGIIVGIQTSCDAVYHLTRIGPGRYFSRALKCEVELEDELLKPLVSGADAVPFATPPTDTYLIFPYLVADDECRLYTQREMKQFKRTWDYLRKNENRLRSRESGKFDDDEWWRFGRHQNIDKQEEPKLVIPRLLLNLFGGADPKGEVYLDNVDVGGVLIARGWDLYYLLGVLNSHACNFAWRLTSKPFRGGYRSANKQFIAPLPIPRTKDQKPLAKLARELADLHAKRLKTAAAVHRRFQTDLPPKKPAGMAPLPPSLSRKLTDFDLLERPDLFTELQKLAGRKLPPAEREKWDDYLTQRCNELAVLRRRITDKMSELNDRAYSLYRLSKDHVQAIEDQVR